MNRQQQLAMQATDFHPGRGKKPKLDAELYYNLILKEVLQNALYGEEFANARECVKLAFELEEEEETVEDLLDNFNYVGARCHY